MSEIVANHLRDKEEIKIYDPTSGSGSLLINIGKAVARRNNNENGIKYYAQELKQNTYNLTRMPVIHIELKGSNVPVGQACEQIKKYAHEGVYTGIFSLVQIFVAMSPDETRYFANPGPEGEFDPDYQFHWADFNNEPINDWQRIASSLLSIPMSRATCHHRRQSRSRNPSRANLR